MPKTANPTSRGTRCRTLPTHPAKRVRDFGRQTDMKHPAQPEERPPAPVFLASSPACANYIAGICAADHGQR